MDLKIIQDWEQIVEVDDDEMTASGPYPKWECKILHPVEARNYTIDLKKLETGHWRMRVFFKTIREGHRFVKALFPEDPDNLEEAKFLAMKHINRYFEEQLALYNAVCIIHIGRKYTEICDCDESDHSQHLEEWQQPLSPYEGYTYGGKKGNMDIDAYLNHDVCPWCSAPLPTSEEEYKHLMEKGGEDFYKEFRNKEIIAKKGMPQTKTDESG